MSKRSIFVLVVLALSIGTSSLTFASDISSLIKVLKDKDTAKDASYELAKIGKPAVPELIKALESHNKYQKRYAARAIREMGQAGSDAIPALEKLLKDWDTQTREYVLEALGNMVQQVDKVMPILKQARKDGNKDVRKKAKKAIEKLRSRLVESIKNSEEGKSANEKIGTILEDIEKNNEESKTIETASSYTGEKAYITRSETIPNGCIELQIGPYGVPIDATLSEVSEWSKKQGLVHQDDMETEEYYKQRIIGAVYQIEQLRKEGFRGWDPNEGKPALETKLSTEKIISALDYKCSNLSFEYSFDGEKERRISLRMRDDLNTLNNPFYVDKKEKYPLVPVFHLKFGHPVELFRNGNVVYKSDDRIIRNACVLLLFMPQTLNKQEPLNSMFIYFVRTTSGQWKSYAALATFTRSPKKIVGILSNKYGPYRWLQPYKWVRTEGGFEVEPSESTEFHRTLAHLAGFDFEVENGPPDLLVWRTNVFGFGRFSKRDISTMEYRDFSLTSNRSSYVSLFYYDASYGEEIIKKYVTAANAAIKEHYEKQTQQDIQLEDKF